MLHIRLYKIKQNLQAPFRNTEQLEASCLHVASSAACSTMYVRSTDQAWYQAGRYADMTSMLKLERMEMHKGSALIQ